MSSIDQLKSLASSKLGFARQNQFLIELPTKFSGRGNILGQLTTLLTSGIGGSNGGDLNLLCAQATLPSKQIATHDRRIGLQNEKVGYGYVVTDVNLTFYLLNDYGIKKYFDAWKESILDEKTGDIKYKKEYVEDIKIHQLRKPIMNLNQNIGPININVGLGGGSVYSVRLIDAYPTGVQEIQLNNNADGLVELTVQMSYTNWEPVDAGQGWIQAAGGLSSGLGNLF
jgi:hypothetical protein